MKMRDNLVYIGIALGSVVIIGIVIYALRLFSYATTPITLHSPKPGITCATMVTNDGAAISCWKD